MFLSYIHVLNAFHSSSGQPKKPVDSSESHLQSDSTQKGSQALTEHLDQLKTDYSLERHLFW